MTPARPTSAEHALFVGACLGAAMRHGLDVEPIVIDGDYSDTFLIDLGRRVPRLAVVVPPPPDDWTLAPLTYGPVAP